MQTLLNLIFQRILKLLINNFLQILVTTGSVAYLHICVFESHETQVPTSPCSHLVHISLKGTFLSQSNPPKKKLHWHVSTICTKINEHLHHEQIQKKSYWTNNLNPTGSQILSIQSSHLAIRKKLPKNIKVVRNKLGGVLSVSIFCLKQKRPVTHYKILLIQDLIRRLKTSVKHVDKLRQWPICPATQVSTHRVCWEQHSDARISQ